MATNTVYTLLARSSECAARRGEVRTRHGSFQTPVFMPVGTQATVKAVTPENLVAMNAEIILGNTYHLFIRPGHELIESFGGLHGFMHWPGSILTDSGGFQIFSLKELATITEEGAAFRSHLDGSKLFLSPEDAVPVQEALGSDIMMCLDTCIPYPASGGDHQGDRSDHPLGQTLPGGPEQKRAAALWDRPGRDVSGFTREHAAALIDIGFDGYAIGGLSVGEEKDLMHEMTEATVPLLPADYPVYLMGVGTPADLVEGVWRGVDMFDCVMPTRNARNGSLFTSSGKITIKNSRYRDDPTA